MSIADYSHHMALEVETWRVLDAELIRHCVPNGKTKDSTTDTFTSHYDA